MGLVKKKCMRYLRCECGKSEMWTTDGVHDCQGCNVCKTTYSNTKNHRVLQPHTWKTMYNENTGKPYNICEKCYEIDVVSYELSKKVDR